MARRGSISKWRKVRGRWTLLLGLLSGQASAAPPPDPPPLDAASSLQRIQLEPGYQIQLVAAEPLVADPVAIDWGPDGRLWVAEMADYPYGMDGHGKPGGRVRFLEDLDDDGIYDRSTLFLDALSFPTAVMPWRDGVLITAAPELIFARDRDGDGIADERTVLYHGFMEGNQQLRVNGLRYGIDHRVYCAAGGHHPGFGAENVIVNNESQEVIPLGSRDFCFDPTTRELEPLAGPSQFGRVRDDWNHWYGVQNSYPLWHYVLEDGPLRRNSHGRYPDARQQLRLPANPQVFAAKPPDKRYHSFEQAGHYTSACGPDIYRDELLFPRGDMVHAFTCEPFHNVVQHHVLERDGATFRGDRAASTHPYDFFASADYWCRPVMARTGPDGALWIVDMYRYMIEHPDWLPAEGRAELEPYYRAGDDRGRIYRVSPAGQPCPPIPRLDALNDGQLAHRLTSPNGPVRDLAQRLLVDRQARQIAPILQEMAVAHPFAPARLHALYTLRALDQPSADRHAPAPTGAPLLQDQLLATLLADPHPELRRHAVRLATPRAATAPHLLRLICQTASDMSASVRLQTALSLGDLPPGDASRALAELASRSDLDSFQVAAITSSLLPHWQVLLAEAIGGQAIDRRIRRMVLAEASDQLDSLANLFDTLDLTSQVGRAEQFQMLADWLDAVEERQLDLHDLLAKGGAAGQSLEATLTRAVATANTLASDPDAGPPVRIAAWELLRHQPEQAAERAAAVVKTLDAHTPIEVQTAAVRSVSWAEQPEGVRLLIAAWPQLLPAASTLAADVLTADTRTAHLLLDAIEGEQIAVAALDVARRDRLIHHPDARIATRAQELLRLTTNPQRERVIQAYRDQLPQDTNPARGKVHFEKHCATCHRAVGEQVPLGPDLKSLTDRSLPALLSSILDPSRAVEPKYLGYYAELHSGETVHGLIAGESGPTLRLRLLDGTTRELNRAEIEHLQSSQRSFMPDGFEAVLNPQELADLIRYVQELRE